MKNMMDVASYICGRYEKEFGEKIDEMKLHKLMYFAQRESLIQTDKPLFKGEFQGWRFGPVLPELRPAYETGNFSEATDKEMGDDKTVLDAVFENYAWKESWSLSCLSQGETCWKKSREGIGPYESSQNPIPLEDIRWDAMHMKARRMLLEIKTSQDRPALDDTIRKSEAQCNKRENAQLPPRCDNMLR